MNSETFRDFVDSLQYMGWGLLGIFGIIFIMIIIIQVLIKIFPPKKGS